MEGTKFTCLLFKHGGSKLYKKRYGLPSRDKKGERKCRYIAKSTKRQKRKEGNRHEPCKPRRRRRAMPLPWRTLLDRPDVFFYRCSNEGTVLEVEHDRSSLIFPLASSCMILVVYHYICFSSRPRLESRAIDYMFAYIYMHARMPCAKSFFPTGRAS